MSVYPTLGPSIRVRISIYKESWGKAGASLTIKAFMTHHFYRKRREFGRFSTLYKIAAMLFCTLRLIARLTTLWRYDVIIIHREVFPLGDAFFERIVTRINPNVIFDLDDALWAPISLTINQRNLFWSSKRFANTMVNCRSVVAGNTYLADYCRKYNSDVHIIPTPNHDLECMATRHQKQHDKPIIVWIGNTGNEGYLDMLHQPLQRLAKKYDFILRLIGGLDIESYRIPGVTIDAIIWNKEQEGQWIQESNIGIMPLLDKEYEKGKCAFKLVQYFSAGLPVVASPVGMNNDVVEQGKNGYLAKNADDWFTFLEMLITDPQTRINLGQSGYETWKGRFTPEINAKLWLKILNHETQP